MADFADVASDLEQENIRIAFLARKQAERPQATGYCLNALCGNELEKIGQLYCDGQCAAEAHRRSGR